MAVRLMTLLLTLTLAAGCEQALRRADRQPGDDQTMPLPPALARMQKAYADLHTGRFVCLADFNTRPQAALCRTLGPDGNQTPHQPTISVRRSVDTTGAGGLKARLTSPNDELRFDGVRSEKLGVVRDWRKYNLLLFQLYGPPDGLTLEFSVHSGTDRPIRWTRRFLVEPKWQLFRLDLAEIGATIDLANVRTLVWRAPELTGSVDLYLDDLILADNTRYWLNENPADGELYVVSRGRRIQVGARGRFELAFCDGVIVEWHADDGPNLTVRSGLGPWPVPLPPGWDARRAAPIVYDDPALFADWGARVTTTQRLVETSPFRVMLEGVWRFVPAPAPPSPDPRAAAPPEHAWRYTIYPGGQVYVRTTSHARDASWAEPLVGYAVALNGRAGFTRVTPRATDDQQPLTSSVLLSQPGRRRPDLLWCLHTPEAAQRQLELASVDERRIAVTVGDIEAVRTVETGHLLRFWPPDLDAAPEARTFAADYQHPATLAVSQGHAVVDAPGDLNGDGFNESEGCYELAPQDGLLRFRFRPGPHLRHQPVFRVHGTAQRDCWVYADGAIVRNQGRDQAGNLLFTIPRVVTSAVAIEVNTRQRVIRP